MAKPPDKPGSQKTGSEKTNYELHIFGDFHYQANDLAELKKLADAHPDLAKHVVEDRHKEFILKQNSERLGMILASVVGVSLILGVVWAMVDLGWWQSIMLVASLLGISHVLRVILRRGFNLPAQRLIWPQGIPDLAF